MFDYSKMFDLSGRRALVIGGASGIGQASALGLAAHGAEVVVADVDVALTHRTPDSRGLALRAGPDLEAALAAEMAAAGIDDVLLAPGASASDEVTAGTGAAPRAGRADTPAGREARSPQAAT